MSRKSDFIDPYAIAFSGNPLDRHSEHRPDQSWMATRLADPTSLLLPFFHGDPLVINNNPGFLAIGARKEFSAIVQPVFLGVDTPTDTAYFALDASSSADQPEQAPFADIGKYLSLRHAAAVFTPTDLAIAGQGRWLLDWHRRHQFCANCGAPSDITDGGAKRVCRSCKSDHFPRTDPVAIVLAIHGDDCLLGRGPHFPPGFLSALAGFVEPGESMEECATREIFEEAGVEIDSVAYQFSQPWPFPSSLMMGFLARAKGRELTLDTTEIEEARWVSKSEIQALLVGEKVAGLFIPPPFTIAHHLLKRWAEQ